MTKDSKPQAIVFKMDLATSAFDNNPEVEVARLLRKYVDAIEENKTLRGARFIDINGNSCGELMVINKEIIK